MTQCLECSYLGVNQLYKQCKKCREKDEGNENEMDLLIEMLTCFQEWVMLLKPYLPQIKMSDADQLKEIELVERMLVNNERMSCHTRMTKEKGSVIQGSFLDSNATILAGLHRQIF